MLCDLIKNENELYGYSAMVMNQLRESEPETVKAYVEAFNSAKDDIVLVNRPEVVALYFQAVRLIQHNKTEEFCNYFLRNFSSLLLQVAKKRGSDEIKKHGDKMLELSMKYPKADLNDMKWGVA
jgi:hypothetical protein